MLWKRLALITFGLLLALVLLEVALQAAALVAQARVRAGQPGAAGAGDVRVLCVGDSNTYGLYLDRSESYPAQLEAIWNAGHEARKLEVMNLGMPGTNSSWLVRESERMLETFEPDLLVVMVGANDFWTRPVPPDDGPGRVAAWLQRLRLVRVLDWALEGRDPPEVDVVKRDGGPVLSVPLPEDDRDEIHSGEYEVRYGDARFAMSFELAPEGERGDHESLRRNLETLVARARGAGAEALLMTYPSDRHLYAHANRVLRAAAAATDAPLLDLAPRFASLCPDEACPVLFFEDGHPKAPGYRRVADALAGWLEQSDLARAP